MVDVMKLVEMKTPGVVAGIRWPDGKVTCPTCKASSRKDGLRDHGHMQIQQFRCTACDRTFNEYTGTILEGKGLDVADLLALYAWTGREPEFRPTLRAIARTLDLSPETVRHWLRNGVKAKDHWYVLRRKALHVLSQELFPPPSPQFRIIEMATPSRSKVDLNSLEIVWTNKEAD